MKAESFSHFTFEPYEQVSDHNGCLDTISLLNSQRVKTPCVVLCCLSLCDERSRQSGTLPLIGVLAESFYRYATHLSRWICLQRPVFALSCGVCASRYRQLGSSTESKRPPQAPRMAASCRDWRWRTRVSIHTRQKPKSVCVSTHLTKAGCELRSVLFEIKWWIMSFSL